MTIIEQIKAEIERRRDFYYLRYTKKGIGSIEEYRYDECVSLLSFLSTLESEKPTPAEGVEGRIRQVEKRTFSRKKR